MPKPTLTIPCFCYCIVQVTSKFSAKPAAIMQVFVQTENTQARSTRLNKGSTGREPVRQTFVVKVIHLKGRLTTSPLKYY